MRQPVYGKLCFVNEYKIKFSVYNYSHEHNTRIVDYVLPHQKGIHQRNPFYMGCKFYNESHHNVKEELNINLHKKTLR